MIVWDGQLVGYLGRTQQNLLTFPEQTDSAESAVRALTHALARLARPGKPVLLVKIDGQPAARSDLAQALQAGGFESTSQGLRHKGTERAGTEHKGASHDA